MHTITSQSYMLDTDTLEWVFSDGRRIPVIAGGDDGAAPPPGGAPEGQPEGDGDPGHEQDGKPPTQPGKAKEKGAAPWAKDLEAMRDADDPFDAFDEYLRSNVQPRMTQHEQSLAEFNKMFGDMDTARKVVDFLSYLEGNPTEAMRQLSKNYGVDPLDLLEELAEQAEQQNDSEPDGKEPADDEDRKWVQQKRQEEQQAKQDKALEDLLKGFEDEVPGFDRDLYIRILKASDFDAEAALEDYMKWHKEPEPPDDPPPTGGGNKGATPREAPKRGSIADAMSSFFRDEYAKA